MIFRVTTLATVGFIAGTLGMWAAERDIPAQLISADVLENPVQPGGVLRIRYHVLRTRECSLRIDRVLYDAQRAREVLEDRANLSTTAPVGADTYIVLVKIPVTFSEGPASYQTVSRYECNPLHRIWPIISIRPEIRFDIKGPALPADRVVVTP